MLKESQGSPNEGGTAMKTRGRPRTADRHKKRRMIGLAIPMYARLKKMADDNGRPILWQIRILLETGLNSAGY